jgi:hypothetical protein
VPVFSGLSGMNEIELNASPIGPFFERLGCELRSMIDGDRDRRTRSFDRSVQGCRNVAATERISSLKQRTLTTKLIDDGKNPKRPSIEQLIVDEFHAPALMGTLRLGHRPAMQAHVIATPYAHPDLQPFMAIPATDALAVHRPAFPTQHHVDALITEAWPGMRKLSNAEPQCRLVPCLALGIPPSMRELPQLDRLANAHRIAFADPLSQRASARWPQSFFRTTSPRMCWSRVSSATSRFRRAFASPKIKDHRNKTLTSPRNRANSISA